jgi:hypothetical protein
MIGIFGSGFGMYGYLPAISSISKELILVPNRYKEKVELRLELKEFFSYIEWVENDIEILNSCSTLILAQTPEIQNVQISRILKYPNIKNILIEKPIAPSPIKAIDLLNTLIKSNKNFRIAYTFKFTKWFFELDEILNSGKQIEKISIKWNFRAHHYRNNLLNWKRDHDFGGGAIRFYGIHIISLLSLWNYNEIISTEVSAPINNFDLEEWNGLFINQSNQSFFAIELNTNSDINEFEITALLNSQSGENYHLKISDPFSNNNIINPKQDNRINVLIDFYNSLFSNPKFDYLNWYSKTNLLWNRIEEVTIYNHNKSCLTKS